SVRRTSVSSGARKITRVMRRAAQIEPSGLANSRSPASPTPSAQRTGVPTARSRSIRRTSSSGAARLVSQAATEPAGPAPTTRTSTSTIRDHRQRGDGAGRDAFVTAGTGFPVNPQIAHHEMDRLGRAEREAQTAAIAAVQVDDGHFGRGHARHGARVARGRRTVNCLELAFLL